MAQKLPWPDNANEFRAHLLTTVRAALSAGSVPHLRFVALGAGDKLNAVFGRIDVARRGDVPGVEVRPKFPIHFLEWQPPADQFPDRLQSALSGHALDVNGSYVSAHGLETPMEAWRHDTDREDYGTHWPVVVVSGDAPKGRPKYDNIIPTDTDGRVFRNLDDAVWHLSGFRPSAGQGTDQRPLRSQIIIWDYRGRIATRTATTRQVAVEIEPRDDQDLVLLGTVDLEGERQPLGVNELAPGEFKRSFDKDVTAVRFQLWTGAELLDQASQSVPGRAAPLRQDSCHPDRSA